MSQTQSTTGLTITYRATPSGNHVWTIHNGGAVVTNGMEPNMRKARKAAEHQIRMREKR